MLLRAVLQPLLSKLSRAGTRKTRPRPARRARLGLEWLEDRVVPNNARLLWVRQMADPVT